MNIVPVMITCPDREKVCQQTLENLAATDWPAENRVLLSMDSSQAERRQERQEQNSLHALRLGLQFIAEKFSKPEQARSYILFLEDDLEFNAHLYHNLTSWR